MATEEQGAIELSDRERVELKQLAELILETAVSDELFADLIELSAPILAHARDENPEDDGTWSAGSGWSSFPTYQAALEVLFELLLGDSVGYLADDADQKLTEAARSYGQSVSEDPLEDAPPVTEAELDEIMEILEDRFGPGSFEREVLSLMLGEAVPEFLREARGFGWLDPAAVEATVEYFADPKLVTIRHEIIPADELRVNLDAAQQSLIAAIREAATSYSEGNIPSILIEIPDAKEIPEELRANLGVRIHTGGLTAEADELAPSWEPPTEFDSEELEADLSPEDEESDTSDEGEWGLAEIDGEDEPEDDGAFALDSEHSSHEHHGHVHQILDEELLGASDYDGDPTDEREIATLALIAEGVLLAELSEILLQDLVAEAEPLIRRARARGGEWWMTREATTEVAELLSTVLIGAGWPTPASSSDADVLSAGRGHRELLKRHALSYPLDPDPTREERLLNGSLVDRYELLLAERGERKEDELTRSELERISEVIAALFGEEATPRLLEDAADLLTDSAIDAGRYHEGWHQGAGGELADIISSLITGISTRGKGVNMGDELLAGLRTYRTEDLTEDEFIAHYDQTRWPSVGATVDLSIFTIIDGKLQVLLIERGNHPEKGKWALPGGFVNIDESLDQAAARELQEETAVDLSEHRYLEQVRTYGYPGRDRRGYIISTLYAALIAELPEPEAGDDASGARFFPVDEVLAEGFPLAFDHAVLLGDALERVRAKLEYSPIGFDFLPEGGFTLTALREVYETVWGFRILPSDFNRRMSQAPGALSSSADGLWTRGSAATFFPPLDRREVVRN